MKKKYKEPNKLKEAILETAEDMFKDGILSDKELKKITMRHLDKDKIPKIDPISAEEIRAIREKEHLSQAVFANALNLTVGYISQLERGLKHPSGAVLMLLDIVRRKGLKIIRH